MKPVVLAPDAQAEFEAAVERYETKAAGFGERFVSHVDEVLQLVQETPDGFPTWNVDRVFEGRLCSDFRTSCSIATLPTGSK